MTETTEPQAAPKPVMINATQGIVLGCLHSGDKVGADIDAIAQKYHAAWNVTRSQIYRELPLLAQQGLVFPRQTLPKRKWAVLYSITPEGQKAFRNWWYHENAKSQQRDPWLLRKYLLSELEAVPEYDEADLYHEAVTYYTESMNLLTVQPEEVADAMHEFWVSHNKLMADTFANWATRA